MKRLARSGIGANVLGFESFEVSEGSHQVLGQSEMVASAFSAKRSDRRACFSARSKRVFIGVEQHRIAGSGLSRTSLRISKISFGGDLYQRSGGSDHRCAHEAASRQPRKM